MLSHFWSISYKMGGNNILLFFWGGGQGIFSVKHNIMGWKENALTVYWFNNANYVCPNNMIIIILKCMKV